MGHSLGDGIIVLALAGAIWGYFYLKHRERVRRLEIIHQERLTAMDKGIPLPELPIDPPAGENRPDPNIHLIIGAVFLSLGSGAMMALYLLPSRELQAAWPLPLPLSMLGLGLILYHYLASREG